MARRQLAAELERTLRQLDAAVEAGTFEPPHEGDPMQLGVAIRIDASRPEGA